MQTADMCNRLKKRIECISRHQRKRKRQDIDHARHASHERRREDGYNKVKEKGREYKKNNLFEFFQRKDFTKRGISGIIDKQSGRRAGRNIEN